MGLREKYVLYNLLYFKAAENVLHPRGATRKRPIMPWDIRRAALRMANHILAAIGETLTMEEIIQYEYKEA